MAKPGPRKRPTALTAALGNPGHRTKDQLTTLQPEVLSAPPKPPAFLDKVAKDEFNRVAKELTPLGLLTDIDTPMFSLLWYAYSKFREYVDILEEDGETIETPAGTKISPYVTLRDRAFSQFCSLCREFGLTPSARAGLNVNPGFSKAPTLADVLKELPEVGDV